MKFIKTLHGEVFKMPPVWIMRQAGRYLPEYRALRNQAASFMDFCLTPEMAVEATMQPLRRFNFDAAIIFSDILMVPYGLGQEVSFKAGEGPRLGPLPDLEGICLEQFHKRVSPVYSALAQVRSQLTIDKALIGFAGAPWTVLTYMCEGGSSKSFDQTRELVLGQPVRFARIMDIVVDATSAYLYEQVKAGANAVQIFDSWAGQVPAYLQEQLIFDPTARIVKFLNDACPEIPVIGFPRGLSHKLDLYRDKTAVNAMGLDSFTPPEQIKSSCPIQGGMDPALLVVGGDIMEKQARLYLDAFRNKPYIFNLGHGILPHTPLQNVEHLFKVIEHHASTN